MSNLQATIQNRQIKLVSEIKDLAQRKQENIDCISLCYTFIKEAIHKAEQDDKEVPKHWESLEALISSGSIEKTLPQARVTATASLISDEFAGINKNNEELMKYLAIEDSGLKMFSYIYHPLFISLISALDDFFSQLLLLVLKAHPEKLSKKKQNLIEITFCDLDTLNKKQISLDLLLSERTEKIVEIMDQTIEDIVKKTMYDSPLDYFKDFEVYLNLPKSFLRLEWLRYVEMCIRRNTGVHSGWLGKDYYNKEIQKVKAKDQGEQLKFAPITIEFTGFDADYFCQAYRLARQIIHEFESHCEAEFKVGTSNDGVK